MTESTGATTVTSLPTAYSPSSTEAKWYAFWEEHGLFEAGTDPDDDRETYMIAIPPPNITGTLHMGHACRTTFEDVLTRYHRMRGKNTLWLPGTDHAGIASLGQLLVVGMGFTLAGNLVLLPALLMLWQGVRQSEPEESR